MELSCVTRFIMCLSSNYDFVAEGGIGMEYQQKGASGLVKPMPDPGESRRPCVGKGGSPREPFPAFHRQPIRQCRTHRAAELHWRICYSNQPY